MSTVGQPHMEPAWKQEVARRLAAHKHKKGSPAGEAPLAPEHLAGNSRAAQAAARVAARFANAKSYDQMQAEEARLAVRAAEIATQVALEAQAAAESALAELHAAANEAPSRGPAVVESISRGRVEEPVALAAAVMDEPGVLAERVIEEPAIEEPQPAAICAEEVVAPAPEPQARVPEPPPVITQQVVDGHSFGIRWEPDTPIRVLEPKSAPRAQESFELSVEDWWTPAQVSASLRHEPISVEAQPTQANLIEFPRELVATRKMRPRLIEPAAAPEGQLSIFEVDPGAVSTEPVAAVSAAFAEPAWTGREWTGREWTGPEWSGIELDEHPSAQAAAQPEPTVKAHPIFLAPLGRRVMAGVVDGALIMATLFASAMMMISRMSQAPAPKSMEAIVVGGLLLVGFLYHAVFFALGSSTPGMRYAGIAFCTFDEDSPNRAQLGWRLGAMALSLIPVGLGFVWSVFDEDHLTWHDRISQTYLRKL